MLLTVSSTTFTVKSRECMQMSDSFCGAHRWTPLTIIYPRWGLLSASTATRNLEAIVTRLAEADVILKVP